MKISTRSVNETHDLLRQHRSGRGGRKSKFQPVIDALANLRKGKSVTVEGVKQNQVQTLRGLIYRHYGEGDYVVKSTREKGGDDYVVVIGHPDDLQ